jgi:hypothetical protein
MPGRLGLHICVDVGHHEAFVVFLDRLIALSAILADRSVYVLSVFIDWRTPRLAEPLHGISAKVREYSLVPLILRAKGLVVAVNITLR